MRKKKNMVGYLIPLGIIFIFLGFIILMAGMLLLSGQQSREKGSKPKVSIGVGGFIGPIPFGFANSRTMLYVVIGVALFLMIVWLILRYSGVF
jgi:uncharacterized protein (TIGR00304 family)